MAKVLVTGASGRLGSNLIPELVRRGYDVRGSIMPNDPARARAEATGAELVEADLTDADALSGAVAGVDRVIHTAAIMEDMPEGMTNVQYFDVNTRGTFALMDAAVKQNVERFVYTSSTASFDVVTSTNMPITEKHPQRPLHLYGLTKIANERMGMTLHFQQGLPFTVLRPNYIMEKDEVLTPFTCSVVVQCLTKWGTDPRSSFCLPDVTEPWKIAQEQIEDDQELCVPRCPDGGSWIWHNTHVNDVIEAVMLCLEKDEAVGEAFNMCGRGQTQWAEIVPYIAEKLGKSYREIEIPNAWRFWFSHDKAEKLLGYAPQYDAKRMVDEAIEYRSSQTG